jgi:hypothetical protein
MELQLDDTDANLLTLPAPPTSPLHHLFCVNISSMATRCPQRVMPSWWPSTSPLTRWPGASACSSPCTVSVCMCGRQAGSLMTALCGCVGARATSFCSFSILTTL